MELLTTVNNSLLVEIGNGLKNLAHNLGGVLLRELSVFADPVKELSASSQLRDDVVFVLKNSVRQYFPGSAILLSTYP